MKNNFTMITGAGGFLGSYHSETVLSLGNSLVMIDINKKQIDQLKNKLSKKYKKNQIFSFKVDITKEKEIKNLRKILNRKKIFIQSIINNAAIDSVPGKSLKNRDFVDTKQWKKELDVSLLGSYLLIKYFVKEMCLNKSGSVINIGSDLSVIAPNQKIYKKTFKNFVKPATYPVVKHALLGMTKYFASLYGKYGVRFNMISPGPIYNNHKKSFVNELNNIIPMERMGTPNDLKGVVKLFLSSESKYITGQNIIIDGGRTII